MPRLELYSVRDGIVQEQAGLNWCFADAHVNSCDAYIALTADFLRAYPNFFPPHGSAINIVWDDGVRMRCLLEGTQEIRNLVYPKQMSSYGDKSILGSYIRQRLGVSSSHHINMNDLDSYGRNYVDVSLTTTGEYYFDFHV